VRIASLKYALPTVSRMLRWIDRSKHAAFLRTPDAFHSSNIGLFMSRNSHSVCVPSHAGATASDSERLLTKDGRSMKSVGQVRTVPPADESSKVPRVHKNGNRIGVNQRMRIIQKYVVGKTQVDIAKEEGIDRESVRRIVKAPEMDSYVEAKRELWRGLCDNALEVVREKLKEGDKEVALRVLESNGVIPAPGTRFNHNIQTSAKPSQDDRMNTLRACFADVMMERARVFKTPMPELAEIAEQQNIKLDFDLNSASDEPGEEDDES
jgi:hypothetical protein